jgi:hypothetical protein
MIYRMSTLILDGGVVCCGKLNEHASVVISWAHAVACDVLGQACEQVLARERHQQILKRYRGRVFKVHIVVEICDVS